MTGMTHPFKLSVSRTDGSGNIYPEDAAGVTTFILADRHYEASSTWRAGAACRSTSSRAGSLARA
jgi:Cu+-exporting ATPase